MTMLTNHLLAQIVGEPALVEPSAVERFRACLEAVVSSEQAEVLLSGALAANDDFWSFSPDSFIAMVRPYVVKDGILHVPVKGALLHNFPYAFGSYATGYDYIWRAVVRGMEDSNVKGIALVIDSPGGTVAGCGECADKILAAKAEHKKPVRAFAHESAYSAAYWQASTADHITVSRTGGVGSVGVVTMHVDMSAQLEQRGLKVTYIHAGKYKVEGNSTEPLSDAAKARIQARIDDLYGIFVSAVARGRGMDEQAVRDTEALCFTATQAVSNGMADSIGPFDDAVVAFAAFLDDQSDNSGENAMAVEANESAVAQAAVDTARTEGQNTGRSEGAAAERTRIAAILGCDEAKDRPALAQHLAMNTDQSPDSAKALLAVAAKEVAETPVPTEAETAAAAAAAAAAATGTGFNAAMGEGPQVGAGDGGTEAADDGSDVLALAAAHGLKGFGKKSA